MSESQPQAAAAAPLSMDEKWDHSSENAIRKLTLGFALGLFPALLLTRSFAARCGVLSFSSGVGLGMAYREARYLFDKDVAFDHRYLVHLRTNPTEKSP